MNWIMLLRKYQFSDWTGAMDQVYQWKVGYHSTKSQTIWLTEISVCHTSLYLHRVSARIIISVSTKIMCSAGYIYSN